MGTSPRYPAVGTALMVFITTGASLRTTMQPQSEPNPKRISSGREHNPGFSFLRRGFL